MVLSRSSSVNLDSNDGRTDDAEFSSLEGIEFEVEKPVFKASADAPSRCSCRKYTGKRTLLELYLIIIAFVFFVAFVFTVGVLAHLGAFNGNAKNEVYTISNYCPVEADGDTCSSTECEGEARRILSSMDFTAEPCKDFYRFACGSFLKDRSYSEGTHADRYSLIRDETLHLTRKLLQQPKGSNEPKFVSKLKKFYQSCVKKPSRWTLLGLVSDLIEKTNLVPWPALSGYEPHEQEINIEYTLATVRIYGGGAPIFMLNKIGLNNKTLLELSFEESLFSNLFPSRKRNPLTFNDTNKYESLLLYIFVKLQILPERATEEAYKMMRFAKQIARTTRRRKNELNSLPKITAISLSGLGKRCPQFHWTKYVSYLNDNFDSSNRISSDITVIINHIEYTLEICKLLGNTNIRTVYNYVVWNLVASYIPYFDNYILNEVNKMSNHRKFWNANNKRWKNCLALVSHRRVVAPALDYLVIKHRNTSIYMQEVAAIVEELKDVLNDIVSNLDWLGEKAKRLARIELGKINYIIGYEKSAMDEAHLNALFSQMNFTDVFLDNVLTEARLSFPSRFFSRNSPSPGNVASNPLEPTPKFDFAVRSLFVPAGIIQPPFFFQRLPRYLNYGGIGSIVAHELTHSLWKYGQILQEKANDSENEFEEAIKNVTERKLCFSRQYSQFTLGKGDKKINGVRTLEENIADNSGVIQAFKAYERKLEGREEPRLSRLNFNSRQMFFLQFAQMLCETVEDPKRTYTYENHSLKKYRVIGTLQNFPAFSEAFGCKENSPMNPEVKCQIWG